MIQEKITNKIIDLLEDLKIPYMLTGAIAVNFYGRLRLTHDLDIVVQIRKEEAARLVRGLGAKFLLDEMAILQALEEQGMVNALHLETGFKIDFWMLREEEYSQVCFQRKVRKRIFKKRAWLISPEDLVITKLIWFKKSEIQKHLEDAKGIWEIQKGRLDLGYLQKWAKRQKVEKLLEKLG